ncbi:MAG TPA: hypothetical protein DCP63_15635 [Bacteroidetes bacterium]|nr:hypothetical protein [Bacteroidota bacterium]
MKTLWMIVLLNLVALSASRSQDEHLWLRLTENRVIPDAQFDRVSNDTLYILRGRRVTPMPVGSIIEIHVRKSSTSLYGALLGAGIGGAVGAAAGLGLQLTNTGSTTAVTPILLGCVLGGIVGGVSSAEGEGTASLDLKGMTDEEKSKTIRQFFGTSNGAPRPDSD